MTPKEVADLFVELELHLIDSLKRNLSRHKRQEKDEGGVGNVPEHWEAWQSAKLRDIQRFRRENEQILSEYKTTIDAETENLLREQYAEGGSDGFFHTSDDRLKALIHEMQHNEARVERAALRYMNDVYRKTILRTATAMTAGGMTLQKATDEATQDFLAQGINCVQYSNGRCVNIASYAEMALRTCSTRAMLLGEAKQRERLGIDTVLVSQYGACSDTCLPWQGRVYIDDVFQEYHGPRGGSFGISRNGRQYMLLSVAIKGGLFHPNCRHTISNWIEGISTRPEPMNVAEIERINKLEARQRALERAVRRAKREEAGLTDPEARKAARTRRRAAQTAVREFVNENSDVLRRDYWRERDTKIPSDWGTVGTDRNESKNTGWEESASELKNSIEKPEKYDTIKAEITDTDVKAIHDYMSAKSYAVNEKLRTGAPLTDEEQVFVNNLDAALKKMPTYQGNLQRSLFFESDDDVQVFVRNHQVGTTVTYREYISTTSGEIYNPDGQVQIYISDSKRGRDISEINPHEAEILYERDSSFVVVNVAEQEGKYYYHLEEYYE